MVVVESLTLTPGPPNPNPSPNPNPNPNQVPVERIIERDVFKDRIVEVEVERVVEVTVEKVVFKDRDVEVIPPGSLYISYRLTHP